MPCSVSPGATDQWLGWASMKARGPKCHTVSLQGQLVVMG